MPARFLRHADSRRRPYWRNERLLGKTFINQQHENILIIGHDAWTRQQIVEDLKCGNFVAAANLTKIVRKLPVTSLDDLCANYTIQDLFQINGWGLRTMFVFLCAQENKQRDPMKYIDHKPDDVVTLGTEQYRARKQQLEARAAKRKAQREQRNGGRKPNGQ